MTMESRQYEFPRPRHCHYSHHYPYHHSLLQEGMLVLLHETPDRRGSLRHVLRPFV